MSNDALAALMLLLMWVVGPGAVAGIVIGAAFLVARRLISPDRGKWRRAFKIIGLIGVVLGSLVVVGIILFIAIVTSS